MVEMEEIADMKQTKDPYAVVWLEIKEWWGKLNPGQRAILRRARNSDQVAFEQTYFTLLNKLRSLENPVAITRSLSWNLPIVAGVLAHVRIDIDDSHQSVPKSMRGSGSNAVVSDLRFRRLLRVEDQTELYNMMIRMIHMLGNKANVVNLAESLFFWNDQTRKRWASEYYLSYDQYVSGSNQDD